MATHIRSYPVFSIIKLTNDVNEFNSPSNSFGIVTLESDANKVIWLFTPGLDSKAKIESGFLVFPSEDLVPKDYELVEMVVAELDLLEDSSYHPFNPEDEIKLNNINLQEYFW